jgi:hypothetical protein
VVRPREDLDVSRVDEEKTAERSSDDIVGNPIEVRVPDSRDAVAELVAARVAIFAFELVSGGARVDEHGARVGAARVEMRRADGEFVEAVGVDVSYVRHGESIIGSGLGAVLGEPRRRRLWIPEEEDRARADAIGVILRIPNDRLEVRFLVWSEDDAPRRE